MLNKNFFWKNKRKASGKAVILMAVTTLLLVCGGGIAYWYYGIEIPRREAELLRQQQQQKIVQDINTVTTWYEKTLAGASAEQVIDLLNEVQRSRLLMEQSGWKEESFSCNDKTCRFDYALSDTGIYNTPQKAWFGKNYPVSQLDMSAKKKGGQSKKDDFQITYQELSGLKSSKMLALYKSKKPLALSNCSEIVSYINSYNSSLSQFNESGKKNSDGRLPMSTFPGSPVAGLEKTLGIKVNRHGMLSMPVSWATKSESLPHTIAQFSNLAFKSALVIKKVERDQKDGYQITGEMVCKN